MGNPVAWNKTVSLHWQRSPAKRAHEVGAHCSHCKRSELICEITDNGVEACARPAVWIERVIRDALDRKMPACAREHALDSDAFEPTETTQLAEATCDPTERMVDGKTVRECLEAYELNQRNDHPPADGYTGRWFVSGAPIRKRLTPAQKEAARLAWSAALRAKQEEARERERNKVLVDIQEVE